MEIQFLGVNLTTATVVLLPLVTFAIGMWLRETRRCRRVERELEQVNSTLQERVTQAKAELEAVIEACPLAIVRLDQNENISLWNAAAENLFLWKRNEVIGRPLPTIPEEQRLEFRDNLKKTYEGERFSIETKRLTRDGNEIDVCVWNAPLIDPESNTQRGFLAIFEDISMKKKLIQELNHGKISAERATRAKSLFLANIGHEIRNPLNAILGFSDLLKNSQLPENDRTEFLENINRNATLLSQLINDLLDVSKIEAGELAINYESTNLFQIFDDVYATQELRAEERGIKLILMKNLDLPQFIMTDPLRLKQILINLVSNAVKFTAMGSVTMKARYDKGRLIVEVIDTGRGMTATEAKKLFKPYAQANQYVAKEFGGTGLGLFLAKELANRMGGDIKLLSSQPGLGTTFVVRVDAPLAEAKIEIQSGDKQFEKIRGKHVLVVDDSDDNRLIVSRYLAQMGAYPEGAVDGVDGLEKTMTMHPDLILIDIQMPRKNGFETIHDLRQRGINAPAIAMTAFSQKEDKERCLSEGFTAHLGKPISKATLENAINSVLH